MSAKEMKTNEAIEWVAEVFEESPENLSEDTQRESLEGWDSLGMLNLMASLDEEFDIVLSDTDVEILISIKDIIGILKKNGVVTED